MPSCGRRGGQARSRRRAVKGGGVMIAVHPCALSATEGQSVAAGAARQGVEGGDSPACRARRRRGAAGLGHARDAHAEADVLTSTRLEQPGAGPGLGRSPVHGALRQEPAFAAWIQEFKA
jgi:hypothetical protein